MAVPEVIPAHPSPAAARMQQRAVRAGQLIRVGHGFFVRREDWERASACEQHIARATAAHAVAPRVLVSHASAAIVHRLPWIQPAPDRVTVLDPLRNTAQRTRFTDKAAGVGRSERFVRVAGLPVTTLVDTVVDIALRYDRARALAVADAVLRRGIEPAVIDEELTARTSARASRRARRVLELASDLSESAGESVTHLVMRDVGCPAPVQQHEFCDASGFIGRADFWFPDQGVIVEFDGLVKYRDPVLRNGRSAEDVVIAEKIREDRLRALDGVRRVVRPIWRDVVPGGGLPAMLADAGLPVRRGVRTTPSW
ncbi:hypothetical protein FHW23_002989 [Curtobacterium pusillum]|uniref:Transcriptional regulator, AbiEi antitoxin, Type IV TA system n=1 Tax=Curtobacterium pusillum TaxID=69373 RepID=A0AAW3TA26_9MICO|nr:hypothetical protein [Curtobacterium pusillum]MBA8991711.1 hypothetical protein [Curtobacterium pusillum]